MDLQLKNKKAFVSGSTAGIGLAIAEALLKEEATVIINGRSQESIDKVISDLKATFPNGNITGIAADFGSSDDVAKLLAQLPEIDILINNVGIFDPKPFVEIPDEEWFQFFEVNVMSGIRLSRHVFPKMLEKDWGRIIFISSESAVYIPEEMIQYGMTKTAQLAISRGLAELTKGSNVTVNSILPGPTKSRGVNDFIDTLSQQQNISKAEMEKVFFKNMRPTSLIQRFASTEEIANMVAFISSPLASATNGATIRVEGGLLKAAF